MQVTGEEPEARPLGATGLAKVVVARVEEAMVLVVVVEVVLAVAEWGVAAREAAA